MVHPQTLASTRFKSNEEVKHDAVHNDGCNSNRDVDEGHGDGFNEWMVHCCLLMTQDQGTMSIQGRNFSQ